MRVDIFFFGAESNRVAWVVLCVVQSPRGQLIHNTVQERREEEEKKKKEIVVENMMIIVVHRRSLDCYE